MKASPLYLVVVRVTDLERSVRFYSALGMVFHPEQHGNGPKHATARTGHMYLELYPTFEPIAPNAIRLGFSVDGIEEVVSLLVQAGGVVTMPVRPSDWGKRAVLSDPDGYKIELVEA